MIFSSPLPTAILNFANTGILFSVDEVFEKVANTVLKELKLIVDAEFEFYKSEYEAHLFRKGVISTFESSEGKKFNGIIEGISDSGLLLVRINENEVKEFRLKDIKLLY